MKKTAQGRTVGARLSFKLIDEIDKIVEEGRYLNRADFIRNAVREKVDSMNTSEKQAEKEQ